MTKPTVDEAWKELTDSVPQVFDPSERSQYEYGDKPDEAYHKAWEWLEMMTKYKVQIGAIMCLLPLLKIVYEMGREDYKSMMSAAQAEEDAGIDY